MALIKVLRLILSRGQNKEQKSSGSNVSHYQFYSIAELNLNLNKYKTSFQVKWPGHGSEKLELFHWMSTSLGESLRKKTVTLMTFRTIDFVIFLGCSESSKSLHKIHKYVQTQNDVIDFLLRRPKHWLLKRGSFQHVTAEWRTPTNKQLTAHYNSMICLLLDETLAWNWTGGFITRLRMKRVLELIILPLTRIELLILFTCHFT